MTGADYFEKVFSAEIKRSVLMAKYALLEKAQLLNAERHVDDALRTLERMNTIPGGDALLARKKEALAKTIK